MNDQTRLSFLSNSCIGKPLMSCFERDPSNSLSFDKIIGSCLFDLRKSDKATYGKSLGGDSFIASDMKSENLDIGMNSICDSILLKTSSNSDFDSFDLDLISGRFRLISDDKFSGAINFNSSLKSFHSNKSKAFPFFIKADRIALASGIMSIYLSEIDSLYFFARDSLTFLPISNASLSENSDLFTIDLNLAHSNTFSRINSAITLSQSMSGSSDIFCFKSSDISIVNSVIDNRDSDNYLSFSSGYGGKI
jgi:hypothetical protein